MVRTEVRQDALAQVIGLADVQRQVVVAIKQVHPMPLGNGVKQSRIQVRGPTAAPGQLHTAWRTTRARNWRPSTCQNCHSTAHRPARGPRRHVQAMPLNQGIQAVRLAYCGYNCRDSFTVHSTGRLEVQPQALEFVFQKAVVEPRVMRHKQAPMQSAQHLISQSRQTWAPRPPCHR